MGTSRSLVSADVTLISFWDANSSLDPSASVVGDADPKVKMDMAIGNLVVLPMSKESRFKID